jgi:hypothetical protein
VQQPDHATQFARSPNASVLPTPDHSDVDDSHEDVWRDGSVLVMTTESVLPPRCIRCNAPAPDQYERNLSWNPLWVKLLVFVSMLPLPLPSLIRAPLFPIGIILVFTTMRKAVVRVGLCASHYNKRSLGLIVGGTLIAAGLLSGVYVALTWDYGIIPWAIVITLLGAFVTVLLKDTLAAQNIEEPYVWVKGIDQAFLNSLPFLSK